jgi:glycosyltransferase involved in cell wall biosynthesis
MKALHVITGLAAGGAETELRLYLQHTRHRADVVTLYNPGAVADGLRADGVRVVDLGMRSNRDLRAVRDLVRLIRRERYDVVHTHLYRAGLYGRLAARLAKVPRIVSTEHSLRPGYIEGRPTTAGVRALYRGAERLGDMTVAVSASVAQELRALGLPAERVTRIPNGVDLAAFAHRADNRARVRRELGVGPDELVIGGVGRLHFSKAFDVLVRAARPLLRTGAHLVIIGDGPERARLAELAAEEPTAGRVHLLGERPALPVLSALDVFASPAVEETFGIAIVEALANGLPVVYRQCPALEELGVPVRGAVAVAGDEAEFAAGLQTAVSLRDPSRPAPPELAPYSIDRVAASVDALYDQLGARR